MVEPENIDEEKAKSYEDWAKRKQETKFILITEQLPEKGKDIIGIDKNGNKHITASDVIVIIKIVKNGDVL